MTAKAKLADPERFKAKHRLAQNKSVAKKKTADPEGYAKMNRCNVEKTRENKNKTPRGGLNSLKNQLCMEPFSRVFAARD